MASHSENCKFDGIEDQNAKVAAVESPPTENTAMSSTTILDLNDDCLREVYQYMDLRELINIADVCYRFREVAQSHFDSLKLMKVTKDMRRQLPIRDFLRFIRNFGQSIISLEGITSEEIGGFLIETIMLYCGEQLKTLTLERFEVKKRLGKKMQPLLLRLHTFGLIDCDCTDPFYNMLPSCLPELRKLELKSKTRVNCWDFIQTYPKLEELSIGYLSEKQFEEFLKKNQQLKSIQLDGNCESGVYLDIICKHLPTIESLSFFLPSRRHHIAHWEEAAVHNLSALKKLVIYSTSGSNFFMAILRKLAEARTPLETLLLYIHRYYEGVVDIITQFENLKTLHLVYVDGIQIWHLHEIVEKLGQLTEFLLTTGASYHVWSIGDFLEFIGMAKKLKILFYCEETCGWSLDEDTFMKIVDVVANREEKIPLKVHFLQNYANPPHYVRKELRNEYKDLLSYTAMTICKNC